MRDLQLIIPEFNPGLHSRRRLCSLLSADVDSGLSKRKQTEPLPVSVGPIAMSSRHYTAGSSSHSVYSDFQDDSPSSESMEASSYTESEMDASEFNARDPSIFSFSSSRDARQLLKEAEGRVFNAQSDVYYLPAGNDPSVTCPSPRVMLILVRSDEDEFDRL